MSYPILYVDDDEDNLLLFRSIFEPEFQVLTALSGEEALSVVARADVAVVLSDQRMPGISGVELAESLSKSHPDVVRYLVTAYRDLAAAVDGINKGAIQRYLTKPWKIDELRRHLREDSERFAQRRRVRELERRMREVERIYTLGVVAAGIAHELRNPITVAEGNLDLARARLRALSEELGPHARLDEALEYLVDVDEALDRIREIVGGVELTSRPRDEATCDLAEVVRLTLRMTSGDSKHLTRVETEVPERVDVHGASTRLGQVVLNLILNGVQALPTRPHKENLVSVRLRTDRARGRAVLEVEDNGSGMTPDVEARVFDPFFTTKTEGGTGLGLAICKQIVEELGGAIRLRTAVGQGSCFTVEVPLVTI